MQIEHAAMMLTEQLKKEDPDFQQVRVKLGGMVVYTKSLLDYSRLTSNGYGGHKVFVVRKNWEPP